MATVPLFTDEAAGPEARAVFDDIRAVWQTDHGNTFRRALANEPATMAATRARLKASWGRGGSTC